MVSILYISNKNDVFKNSYYQHMDPERYHIFNLALAQGQLIDLKSGKITQIIGIRDSYHHFIRYALRYLCALVFLMRYSNKEYDVIHILNIKRENFLLIPFLRKTCKKLIITVYGRSTFLYPTKRLLFSGVYKHIDLFVFSNQSVINEFLSFHKNIPVNKLIQGIPPLSNLKANKDGSEEKVIAAFIDKYKINKNLIRISCSSTIHSYDQHDKIIEALKMIRGKDKVQLMFLLTYGGTEKEKLRIIDKINTDLVGFNVRLFTSFMDNSELLAYRALTDIYINMRTSDQLAGALLESLYEGALMISGRWLNYETLDNLEIYYKKVNNFDELPGIIDDCIDQFSHYKKSYAADNAKKITDQFSLDAVIKKWEEIYSL